MAAGLGRLLGIPAALSRRTPTPLRLTKIPLPNLWRAPTRLAPGLAYIRCLAGVSWFDPPRQPLVASSNLAQFQANIHVVHGLGSEQDFFGACSKAAGQRSKLRIQHWNAFEQRCGPK